MTTETTTLEQVEKLLIHQNTQQTEAITFEIQQRARLLNNLMAFGLTNEEIKEITVSANSIEGYILKQQLTLNRELAKLVEAGIKGISAELPQELAALRYGLLAWHNYPGSRNKFEFLKFAEGKFQLDEDQLENHFVKSRHKFYVEGEQLNEFREIGELCKFFEKNRMPSNQIKGSSFLWDRIEPVGMYLYKPRVTWFMRERN